jgi:hypothetical protein
MHESFATTIAPVVEERWKAKATEEGTVLPKHPNASFRAAIAREMFGNLPETEQDAIRGRAVAEARAAKDTYNKTLKDGPAKTPEARQRYVVRCNCVLLSLIIRWRISCIDALALFMAPLLKGLQEYTGLQGLLVLGGPIPKYNGEIGTVQ